MTVFMLAGIFSGSLCDTFGCRVVAVLGNAIVAVGLVSAAFAPDFSTLFCSYGLLCGKCLLGNKRHCPIVVLCFIVVHMGWEGRLWYSGSALDYWSTGRAIGRQKCLTTSHLHA